MVRALLVIALGLSAVSSAVGCGYSGVTVSGDKAVVARNDYFLFGALRKVHVCKISDAGLTSCADSESP
ncbi:hypothetical protein LVJ94_44950 [Pendulispora rubella]|uniref:Lipoprotein n=1 Tax=Pendulispora rubella TaxID=2741070 RepID=A0ABZ2KZD4_9BACT